MKKSNVKHVVGHITQMFKDYENFWEDIMSHQINWRIILGVLVGVYSLGAPVLIHYAVDTHASVEFLIVEFAVMLLFCVLGEPILLYLKYSKRINDPAHIRLKRFLYELTAVMWMIGSYIFSGFSMYFASTEGRTTSMPVCVIATLIITLVLYMDPLLFIVISCLGNAVMIWEYSYLCSKGQSGSDLYNLYMFFTLFLIAMVIKQILTLRNKRQAAELEKMRKDREMLLIQMTHELRTPLNAILGKNRIIMQDTEEQDTRQMTMEIDNTGKIMLALIGDVLDASKLGAGKMNIVETEYMFNDMVRDVVSIMYTEAEQHGLKLIPRISPDIPKRLIGDPVRIKQVLMNLLSNAVKYTREGTVTLVIEFTMKSNDEGILRVSVNDTGIGIKPEDIPKITGEFARVDEKNNIHTTGTGLGLTITTGLLLMMHSQLEINSVYGKGSQFSFSLPQKIADWTARDDISMDEPKLKPTLTVKNAKVLVVDDNRVNFMICKGLLKRFGIDPSYVNSGEACLEALKVKKFDLVLLDHMMPEMDGIETLTHIKREMPEIYANMPVVALTANVTADMDSYYRGFGFAGALSKPMDVEELEKMLAQQLSAKIVHGDAEQG